MTQVSGVSVESWNQTLRRSSFRNYSEAGRAGLGDQDWGGRPRFFCVKEHRGPCTGGHRLCQQHPCGEVRHRPEAFRSPGRLSASALCSLPMAPAAEGQRDRGQGERGDPAGPQTLGEALQESTPLALTAGSGRRQGGSRDRRAALLSFPGSVASARSFRPGRRLAGPAMRGRQFRVRRFPPPNRRGGAGQDSRAGGWGGAVLKGQASPRPKMSRG